MASRFLVGAASVALAVAAAAVLYIAFTRESTVIVPEMQARTVALVGTSLTYVALSGWDDTDHSSCDQPCVRMWRLPSNNGAIRGPSITLQRIRRADSGATPVDYAQAYSNVTKVEHLRVGSREGVQFKLLGFGFADSSETGRSFEFQTLSRHFVFEAERMLYECVIFGSPADVETYASVYLYFCGSVRET